MRTRNDLRIVSAIAKVTFFEIVRDKVLYNFLVCFVLLSGLGYLASRLTAVSPDRVIVDFGLTAVLISSGIIAIFTGSVLISREFERRTVHLVFARPVSRIQFVVGKFGGLVAVLFVNWLLQLVGFFVLLWATSTNWAFVTWTLVLGLFFVLIQGIFAAGIAMVFSSFSTTSMSVMLSIGLFVIANNLSQLRLLAARAESEVARKVLKIIAAGLPDLEYFNLGSKVTYGLPVSGWYVVAALGYAIVWIALLLTLAGWLVRSREV